MSAFALHDIFRLPPAGHAPSPLAAIERLAAQVRRTAPDCADLAEEIAALAGEARRAGPTREEILEAVESACDEELSGPGASRIAEAVTRLMRRG